jgi:hypothetical protein
MRLIVVLLVLAFIGTAAAVPLASPVPSALARTEAVIARLSTVDGPAEAIDAALDIAKIAPMAITTTRSTSLEQAILRSYAASAIPVDAPLAAKVAQQARAAESPALIELFDAFADAQLASADIWNDEDRALVTTDLGTTLKTITLRPESYPARVAYLAALARVDLPLAAGAGVRLAGTLPRLSDLAPVEGCARLLDLPFILVGAPCSDVYTADATMMILIDYGGDDVYLNNMGAGIAGVGAGLGIDYGEGADVYRAASGAQGSAIGGVGILYDEGGSDLYNITTFGQGWGTAGVGLLYDGGDADDVYESPNDPASLGTKAGGLGGIGLLVDEGGSDRYQQDGLDGFVYGAAGVGILIELGSGDDHYLTRDLPISLLGTFIGDIVGPVQVSAEVNGLAVLYEEGGDDTYTCGGHVRQGCQGAGGVGAVALLLDLSGNDRYTLGESASPSQLDLIPVFPAGQGVAYGEGSAPPGPGLGILRDLGGDDVYDGPAISQGYATGGIGLLLDEGGTDRYHSYAPLVGSRSDGQTWADGLALGIGIDLA